MKMPVRALKFMVLLESKIAVALVSCVCNSYDPSIFYSMGYEHFSFMAIFPDTFTGVLIIILKTVKAELMNSDIKM
jgi:hypothetical protein